MNPLETSKPTKCYFAPYTAVALQPFICKRIDNRIAKGQLISKGNFSVFNSPKKRT